MILIGALPIWPALPETGRQALEHSPYGSGGTLTHGRLKHEAHRRLIITSEALDLWTMIK